VGQTLERDALLQSRQTFATRGFLRVVKRTSRSLGTEDEASAHHQGRVRGRQFNRRHSWASCPSQVYSRCGWRDVSAAPGLHAVRRIPRRDNFRRGIVRPKERYLKGRAIMSSSVQLPGFIPSIDPPAAGFSPRRAILPWALPLAGFWIPINETTARARPRVDHQPPETVSGPYPLMGLTTKLRTK